ncbi:MAG: tetratricopeptide repeat protein [Pseudomonadota bacterium]
MRWTIRHYILGLICISVLTGLSYKLFRVDNSSLPNGAKESNVDTTEACAKAPTKLAGKNVASVDIQTKLSEECATALMTPNDEELYRELDALLRNDFHTLKTDDAMAVLDSFGENVPMRYLSYLGRFAQRPEYPLSRTELAEKLNDAKSTDPIAAAYFAYALAGMDVRSRTNSDITSATDTCLSLTAEHDLKRLRAYCINILSTAAFQRGELGEAVRYFEQAIELFLQIPDPVAAATPTYNIGTIFEDLGDLDRAEEYFNAAGKIYLEELEKDPDSSVHLNDMGYVWRAIGEIELKRGLYDQAINTLDKAIDAQRRAETNTLLARNLELKSRAFAEKGDASGALSLGYQSLDSLKDDQRFQAAEVRLWLADLEARQGRLEVAENHLAQVAFLIGLEKKFIAEEILDLPDRAFAAEFASAMAQNLNSMGQTVKAFEFANVSVELNQSLIDQRDLSLLAEADILFQMRSREVALQAARQRAEIAEQQISITSLESERWRLQALVALALALGVTAALYFFIRAYRGQKELARVQKLLMTENQHRSQNNLQLISSLINMSNRDADGSEKSRDMSSRVQAMALAQNLLSISNLKARRISLPDYIDNLVGLITTSIGRSDITVEVNIADVETDIDKAVPLGLIINESITNSFKYAFYEGGGNIAVNLRSDATSPKPGRYKLSVHDRPANSVKIEHAETREKGFGHRLIQDLAEQLDAEVQFKITDDGMGIDLENLALS